MLFLQGVQASLSSNIPSLTGTMVSSLKKSLFENLN